MARADIPDSRRTCPERVDAKDVRVMIVDDQAAFREALRALVQAAPGFTLVGEATCGEAALAMIEVVCPDFAVIDVRMPGIGGVETAGLLRKRRPGLALLLVSAQPSPGAQPEGSTLPFAAKGELCPAVLREAWERQRQTVAGP